MLTAAILAAIGWVVVFQLGGAQEADSTSFRTAKVEKGDLVVTVAATGTLEPEEAVDVGAQVAGKIQELGIDPSTGGPIDYGSEVEPNTVLARIDPALYEQEVHLAAAQLAKAQARRRQSKAQTVEAHAAVERAEADLVQLKVRKSLTQREAERARVLAPSKAITQEQLDIAEANLETALAAILVGEAVAKQARSAVATAEATESEAEADVDSADATLRRAEKNLDYTTIRSPIKGVIIDRRVNIGQTVVASLNAPSLFLIAKDLKRLQVWASVNEADIGRLAVGQPVSFTVDASPDRLSHGQVRQIRLNASMTQNVVTYTVVVDVDNSDSRLYPYLTANVKFEVSRLEEVLLIPNTALRFKPRAEQVVLAYRDQPWSKNSVWIRQQELLRPLPVQVLESDGNVTAIAAEGLSPGDELVVGESIKDVKNNVVNPLLPQQQQGKKKN
jgi:HlyD family secretion protein